MGRKNLLRNLVIGFTVVFTLLMALGYFAPKDKATSDYAKNHVVPIGAEGLAKLVNNAPSPSLVFFYATWCPYCKEQYKELDTLAPLLVEKNVQKIYIAVDGDDFDVAHFMLKAFPQTTHAETKTFTPYWLLPDEKDALHESLKARKLTPEDAIPYLIVFGPFGKTQAEFHGLTEHFRISKAIREASGK